MEVLVQGWNLPPQLVCFFGEIVRAHVVSSSPEIARIGEANFLRPLVRQLHQALIERAHRRRDGPPAYPGIQELVVIVTARHHLPELLQISAVVLAPGTTPLTLAVETLQFGGQFPPLAARSRDCRG